MEFKGKTLEEALHNAEISTGRSKEEFLYRVIEKKSGLFKAKEFYIKIERFKEKSKIKIKDGKIIFIMGDTLPSIEPGSNISIMVNGREINETTLIRETDVIKINALESELERQINIIISEDNMRAIMEVILTPEKRYVVCDCDEKSNVKVEAKSIKEEFPSPFTIDEAEAILKQNKISYGIKWDNIKGILNGGKCIAAEGLEPESPICDEVKYLFNGKKENKPLEVDGKVDYYNIGETEFVEVGKILAIRSEGRDGKPGNDIFGKIINPNKRKIQKLLAGSGCEAIDDGNRIVSIIKGMPSIKNDRVFVFPVHIINGDVDIQTGNINFEGDIVVKGNIKEGLGIHCGNNLTVYGEVAEANLCSSGNIILQKNAISSTIIAGEKELRDAKAIEYTIKINKFFEGLLEAYHEIRKSSKLPENIKDSQILKILLESKFQSIKKELQEALDLMNSEKAENEVYNLLKTSYGIFKLIDNNILSNINIIVNQSNKNNEFISKSQILLSPADVIVGYCQNSNINATNDLIVKGKGCYNTNISVQNKAVFTGNPGIFRGGQIYAKNAILLKEAGSPAGVLTILRTSKGGVIEVKLAYQNTVINIGDQVYKVEYPVKMLKAYMQKGELIVEKLKV